MDKLDYLIINLDTPEKLNQVRNLPNCNPDTSYGLSQSLYSISHDLHHLRSGMRDNDYDRMFIPSIVDIPRVKLLLSLGLNKEEVQEILNE